MRTTLKDLMDELGVGYILSAYETCPWSVYDNETGISCSAEVRMNSDADELEAEMQFMHENPKDDEKSVEQIFWLLAKPAVGDKWDVKIARIKEENKADTIHGWEEKSVSFFHACVQELKIDKLPDIDEILEGILKSKERFGDNSQGGGSKAPKVKPQALLGMKGGRGF